MKIWPAIVGVVAVGAGFGGSQIRRQLEMGAPVPASRSVAAEKDKLLASTTNVSSSNESDFFYELLNVIKQNYVDPVSDEQKLAVGAVRGMVNSLSDPDVQYLNEKQVVAFDRTMKGDYEGIGIELKLAYDQEQLLKFRAAQAKLADWNENGRKDVDGKPEELPSMESGGLIPDVIVAAVIPGSPADKAGLKVGDQIDGADGKWSISRSEILELNRAFDRMRLGKAERDAYLKLREVYLKRSDNAISAMRLREKITTGTEGTVKLVWKGPDGVSQSASIARTLTKAKPLTGEKLLMIAGVADAIGSGTDFDLRGSGFGDFTAMNQALEKLLPSGDYGHLSKGGQPFKVNGSGSLEPRLTLKVDHTTIGAARLFAGVLRAAGKATLVGDLGPEPILVFETVRIQGGTAYVLPTDVYKGGSI